MRYRPHYDKNGNRIYYLAWRKKQKQKRKQIVTACLLATCTLATGRAFLSMHHTPEHKDGCRVAGVSAYSAVLIGKTGTKTKNPSVAVASKNPMSNVDVKAISAEVEEQSREKAGMEERQAEAIKAQQEELALEQAEEAARQEAERERQAEEAQRKAEEEQKEKALADAAEGNVPMEANRSAHPYMPYTAVTNQGTKQYAVLNGQDAWSDPVTGLRMVGDRICIAIGQGYGIKAGEKVDVVLDDDSIVKCIVGDMKALCDTDPNGLYHNTDKDVVEMVVDYAVFTRDPNQYLGVFHGQPVKKLVKIQ